MTSQLERIAFLKIVWLEIIAVSPERIHLVGIGAFVPDQVADALRKAHGGIFGNCTIDEMIDTCTAMGLNDEAFDLVSNSLLKDWDKLKASVKATIASAIRSRNFEDHPVLGRLKVSSEDEALLRTPWHIVDSLYASRRRIAEEVILGAGLSIRDRKIVSLDNTIPEMLELTKGELLTLFTYHAEVYLALASAKAVPRSSRLMSLLHTRVAADWNDISVDIRDTLREEISFLRRDEPGAGTHLTGMRIGEEVRRLVEPMDIAIDKLLENLKAIAPSVEAIRQVNELLGAQVMSITITGDGNVVGDNNRVVATINKGVAGRSESLAQALALLKGEITELQVSEKAKSKATRAIEDAEAEIADPKDTDESEVSSALKRTKAILEDAGAVYDQTKGWGQRLYEVGKLLASALAITLSF